MKMIRTAVLASAIWATFGSTLAGANEPRAGVHYKALENVQHSDRNIQFFSLGCHHCYRFEKHLDSWDRKESVQRVPLHFDKKQWVHYAKIYFALKGMNYSDDVIPTLFDEIHRNRDRDLSLKKVAMLFDMNEKQTQELKNTYRSDRVEKQVDAADVLARQYRITGVPAMVIQGKYVTDAAMTRGIHGLMRVSEYLYDLGNDQLANTATGARARARARARAPTLANGN